MLLSVARFQLFDASPVYVVRAFPKRSIVHTATFKLMDTAAVPSHSIVF